MSRILAIFKREYVAFFRKPIGYVLSAIFMAVASLYFSSTILTSAIDIVGELSFLMTFLFAIIPLITMRTFSEDRKYGTDVLLLTSPASVPEIVIAKYLAAFALFLTLTAGTLVHVFITLLYGGLLDMNVLGAMIGFVFIGATYIAIGVFASSLVKTQLAAAIMTLIAILLLTLVEFLSGLIRQAASAVLSAVNVFGISNARIDAISASVVKGIAWLNPNARIDSLIAGIFGLSPLVYFSVATAVLLFLTCQVIHKRRTRALRRLSILASASVIVLALVFNIAFDALLGGSLKWDWSTDRYYTVGAVTRLILKDLDKNVELIGLFDEADTTSFGDIRVLLKAYEDQGGGKVKVRYVDPDKEPEILKQLDPDGFLKPQLNTFVVYAPQTGKAKSVAYGDIFSGSVDETTGEATITGVVAEQSISGAIRFVTAEKTPLICFTTGHDEDAFDKTHLTLATILKNNNYDVQSLNLMGSTGIPQDCSAIVMLNPRKDLTEADRNVIGDWLGKGGSLFVMSDFGTVRFPVLNALLADYGVALTTDRIREGNVRYLYQAEDAYTVRAIAPKNALTAEAVDGWTLVNNVRRIAQLSPLAGGITVSPVLTSSSAGASEPDGKTEQGAQPGTQTIGLMAESTRMVDGITVVRSARVLVIGSASFLDDAMLDSLGTQIYNANLFFDGISWLSGSNVGDALFIEPKKLPDFSVNSAGSGMRVATAILVMVVLPGLLLLLALRVHRRRRYR